MRNIEAAVQAYCEAEGFISPLGGAHDAMRAALAAQFVADYGCEHCGGQGEDSDSDDAFGCKADCIELVNPYDSTMVYADRSKVEWRCVVLDSDDEFVAVMDLCFSDEAEHCKGRWVPKPLEAE